MKLTSKVPCPKCKIGIAIKVEINSLTDCWQIKCDDCNHLFIIDAEFSYLFWPIELKREISGAKFN